MVLDSNVRVRYILVLHDLQLVGSKFSWWKVIMYIRKNMIEFGANNFKAIFDKLGKTEQGSLLGNITEAYVVQNRIGSIGTDVSGSDMVELGLLKEIKSCWSYNLGYARWGNMLSKQNKCDAFVFIDGVANKEYEVPHDVVFYEMCITPASGGEIRTTAHNLSILSKYCVQHELPPTKSN